MCGHDLQRMVPFWAYACGSFLGKCGTNLGITDSGTDLGYRLGRSGGGAAVPAGAASARALPHRHKGPR
eukprot:2907117-Rhodomonas_salina.1